MLKYCHLAADDLYLENGYESSIVCGEEVFSYISEDKLEVAIAQHLVHLPKPLNGPQLRFLRRKLGLSQEALAQNVDKDVQTIARLEKSKDALPRPIELVIRLVFIKQFSPQMSVAELAKILDRSAHVPNARVVFAFASGEWSYRYHVPGMVVAPTRTRVEIAVAITSGLISVIGGKRFRPMLTSVSQSHVDFQESRAAYIYEEAGDINSIKWSAVNV